MIINNMLVCKKCGHTWTPRTQTPLACPNCKSYSWNKSSYRWSKKTK